jgi:hypothetical protein
VSAWPAKVGSPSAVSAEDGYRSSVQSFKGKGKGQALRVPGG